MSCEVLVKGNGQEVAMVKDNLTRLVKMNFDSFKIKSYRLKLNETRGDKNARLFVLGVTPDIS